MSCAKLPHAVSLFVLSSLCLVAFGCGGLSPNSPASPQRSAGTLSISPNRAALNAGSSLQFTAVAAGVANTDLEWLVKGVLGGNSASGTISRSGLYTAPQAVASNAVIVVTVISKTDPTKASSAAVTVVPGPTPITVSIAPSFARPSPGQVQHFTATVKGTTNQGISWFVNGNEGGNSSVGTISSTGIYTAPLSVPAVPSVTITATSTYDTASSATAAVTIMAAPAGAGPTPITVSIAPSIARLSPGQVQQFAATVKGTTNQRISWFVNGNEGGNSSVGTISSTGIYTAPLSPPAMPSITITARSTYDTAASATATVTPMGSAAPPVNGSPITGAANNAYYVDASAGNDSNDGRSPTTAWRTIAKVNASSFVAGDQVLFKRGEVWREQLTIPSSGSAGKPITFGAYGSGPAPAIAGSDAITGWIADAGSVARPPLPKVYSATLSFMPVALFRNGVKLGAAKSALNLLNSDGDWYYDGVVYLYSSHDPLVDVLETTTLRRSYGIRVAGKSYVTIQNLQVRQASAFNIETNASAWITYRSIESLQAQSSGFNIENGCNFVTIGGGSLIHDNGLAESGDRNGIGIGSFGNGSSNITVQDSDIYNNTNHNIEIARTDSNAVMANLSFLRNRIHNSLAAGIYIGGAHTGVSVIYNQIYSNARQGLIAAEGSGNVNPGSPVIVACNNVIWGNGTSGGMRNANVVFPSNSTAGSTTFKNNIVAEANGQEIQVLGGAAYTGDYNLFYHSAGGTFLEWYGKTQSFADWKANSLQDIHSVNFDPKLNNAIGGDFTLTAGSPAVDAGANLGSPYNWALDPRSSFPWSTVDQNTFSSWVIGPFVYLPR
jgi:hypothetical protein